LEAVTVKKFLAVFAVMFAVVFVGKVSAQDIYVGAADGLNFYRKSAVKAPCFNCGDETAHSFYWLFKI
jgi:hypothetical protein